MEVNRINQNQNSTHNDTQKFRGSGDAFLRYLATNQAVGANAVDLSFMVIPRTGSDMIRRGPVAGLETGRREVTGTVNHSLVGVYGITAGAIAATIMGIDRKYKTNVNKIMTAPETLNILAEHKASQIKNNTSQLEYLKDILSDVKAFNPNSPKADADGFVKLSQETIDKVAQHLDTTIADMPNMKRYVFKKDDFAKAIEAAVNMVIEDTAEETDIVLEYNKNKLPECAGVKNSKTNLKALMEDICTTSNAFNKDKVKESFKHQIENGRGLSENHFMKALTRHKNIKSIAGFAIAAAIGASVQPLNMYITKKRTGTDGFVGVEGRSKDNSNGFKVLKGCSAAAFGLMVLKTLNTGLKGFMSKMAFAGFWPTISQLKGVYGITIMSRLLSARDKDELRESLTKDTLGFLSWLVLGDIVNRMTAEALDKSVLDRKKPGLENKGFLRRANGSILKTRDEILIETLANNGISSTKEENGKIVAKTFKEMLNDLDKISDKEAVKLTKGKLRTLNKAQLAGYLFSGLVLGLGIPNLNIYITNTLDKKRKAKAQEQEQLTAINASVTETV